MELNAIKTPERNYGISLVRFIAMVFIISCHIFQHYRMEAAWWFNVGVQIFFCISGFLYGNRKITSPIDFFKKNARKILVPYYTFLIPAIILFYLFHSNYVSKPKIFHVLLGGKTIGGLGHLWFISYILFCYFITPYLSGLAEKMKKLKWPMFLLVFGFMSCFLSDIFLVFGSRFRFDRIFCYLFGYFAAVFMQNYKPSIFKILTCLLAILTVFMNAVRIYYTYVSPRTSERFDLFVKYAHAFLGISIALLFVVLFKNLKRNAFLDLSDKYSFFIYIVHQFFILGPFTLMDLTNNPYLNIFIVIVAVLISAVILKYLVSIVEKVIDAILKLLKPIFCSENTEK